METYKVVLLGDPAVGKTKLQHRLLRGRFLDSHVATVGLEFGVKVIPMGSDQVKLHIWDTAGTEKFHSITNRIYLKGAKGVIFVYDVNSRDSFEHIRDWMRVVDLGAPLGNDAIFMLLGNKTDLNGSRMVTIFEGKNFADFHSMFFLESSAKTGENVESAFRLLAAELNRRYSSSYESQEYSSMSQSHQLSVACSQSGSRKPPMGSCC